MAEAVVRVQCHVGLDQSDDPVYVTYSEQIARCGAGETAGLAGTSLAHAVLGHNHDSDEGGILQKTNA